jgi:hypothetical protein
MTEVTVFFYLGEDGRKMQKESKKQPFKQPSGVGLSPVTAGAVVTPGGLARGGAA